VGLLSERGGSGLCPVQGGAEPRPHTFPEASRVQKHAFVSLWSGRPARENVAIELRPVTLLAHPM